MKFWASVITLALGTFELEAASTLRRSHELRTIAEERHTLRICNAYAFQKAVQVFYVNGPDAAWEVSHPALETEVTASSGPLAYKVCQDFEGTPLQPAGRLIFKVTSGVEIGAFRMTHMEGAQFLQIVVYRYDRFTTTAGFASHMSSSSDAEVMIVDAYRGSKQSVLRLHSGAHQQALLSGTVVTLPRGKYKLLMEGSANSTTTPSRGTSSAEFSAEHGEKLTVVRLGVDAYQGPSYPEELLVFPAGGSSR